MTTRPDTLARLLATLAAWEDRTPAYDPAQAAVGPSTPSWLEFSADNG